MRCCVDRVWDYHITRSLSPWASHPGESTEHQATPSQNVKMALIHTTTAKATRELWQMYENDREHKHWTRHLTSYEKSSRPCLQTSSPKYKRCAWPRAISTSCVKFWETTRNIRTLLQAVASSHMKGLATLLVYGGWKELGSNISNR